MKSHDFVLIEVIKLKLNIKPLFIPPKLSKFDSKLRF